MSDEHGDAGRKGPPPVDLNKAVRNPSLVKAMDVSIGERSDLAAERLWTELNAADYLVAVFPADEQTTDKELGLGAEEMAINVATAVDDQGDAYLPLFTDWDAIAAYTGGFVMTLVLPAPEAWSWVLGTEEYAGAVVNPAGQSLALDKDQVAYLMHLTGLEPADTEPAEDRVRPASGESMLEAHRAERIRFVGEQDGPSEQGLKLVLADMFARTRVQRAYLARVDYGDPGAYEVALCLRGAEDPGLLEGISRQFASLFGSEVHMDILFLDDELEAELRTVCSPFYSVSDEE